MSSHNHVSHCRVLPLGEFTVTIPEPHATLQGAVTWRNQCCDRATLQGLRLPSGILKIVFRHILFFLCLMQFRLWRAAAFVSYLIHLWNTKSFAIAERPRDASCLSVVSFNSRPTIPRAPSFLLLTSASDLPMRRPTIQFCSIRRIRRVLKTTSTLAVVNKIHWCVAIVVRVSCDKLYSLGRNCWRQSTSHRSHHTKARYRSKIEIFLISFSLGVPAWMLPWRLVWKNLNEAATRWWKSLKICLFVSTEYTNVTDGRTDEQTPHNGAALMHNIARQKWSFVVK